MELEARGRAGLGRWALHLVLAGGRALGRLSVTAVTRGKNNQERTAASLSATKREIKLMSPPAKTCSPGPLAPATNCSKSACQSNLNACDSPQRGLILTSSSAEKKHPDWSKWEGGAAAWGPRLGMGPRASASPVGGLGVPSS